MKRIFFSVLMLLCGMQIFSQSQPKNIILFVAPGMGYNHVEASKNYTGNASVYSEFPVQAGISNYPAYWGSITEPKEVALYKGDYHIRRIWSEFDYTNNMKTDPASAATALATGKKTAYKAVGVDLDSSSLETILERAFALGKHTGIVTDLPFSKSGVMAFAAHYPYADSSSAIAKQLLLESKLHVLLGIGHPYYNNSAELQTQGNFSYTISKDVWDSLTEKATVFPNDIEIADIDNDNMPDAWTLVDNKDWLEAILMYETWPKRLLGIMPTNNNYLQALNASPETVPSLVDMVKASLNKLNVSPNGFVLVVECGSIDMANQANDKLQMLQAMNLLNEAVAETQKWIELHSSWDNTLCIVAGAYESGFVASSNFSSTQGGPDYFLKSIPIASAETGNTENWKFNSTSPTNLLTPLYAKGMGSSLIYDYLDEQDIVYGPYVNNSEIGQICLRLLPDPAKALVKPKNIILMINDGAGLNQIRAANYYTGTTQAYEDFPVQLFHSTYPLISSESATALHVWNNSYESALAWKDPMYLRNRNNGTCSGASGTAIASGTKTYYYALGVDREMNSVNTIARHARTMGKSMGVASNIPISDATPAVFVANNASRNNASQIFRQMILESECSVIIGGGHPEYDNHGILKTKPKYDNVGGLEFWNEIIEGKSIYSSTSNSGWNTVRDIDNDGNPDPWTVIQDSSQFAALMTGETPKRLLGIAKVESSMQFYRTGINKQEVHFDDFNKNMPDLYQIATVALNVLSKNPNGFFLMIEGDAGDNAGHQNLKGRQIEEQMIFNKAVDSVIAWIENNGGWDENLLIVTSDHETGLLASPFLNSDSCMLSHYDIIDNGPGVMPGMEFYSTHHSNQLVPLYAKGAGAEIFELYADEHDFVRGKFLNNSEIGQAMFSIWDGKPCTIINKKPIIVHAIAPVQLIFGKDTSFSIPQTFIFDEEDTEFTFSISTRPKWLQFNPETFTFSGTPNILGNSNVKLLVSDGKTTGAGISIEVPLTIQVVQSTELESISETRITAYPNPTSSHIIISVPANPVRISLYDAQGKILESRMSQSQQEIISLRDYNAGIYTCIIEDGVTITQQKIILK